MKELNPATSRDPVRAERARIPMSVPVAKLEVPAIPGYHLHWFLGTPERIQRARDAGYELVEPVEVAPNSVGLGSDSAASGSTDMGSAVSVVAGSETGRDGQAVRMVLMKIRQEWWEEDQALIEERNTAVVDALTAGMTGAGQGGETAADARLRYVAKSRTQIPDMFNRNKQRRPLT